MTEAAPVLVALTGDAITRGRDQARHCPDSIPLVRAMLAGRLDATAGLLGQPRIRRYLDAQWDVHGTHDPDGLAEIAGIAEGYGVAPRDVFAFLHAGQLAGLPDDGCSAWAVTHPEHGAMVVKNRDLRGPALPLQRVFRHADPAWGGRNVLCIGSLGAPGAYSSGVNSDGFALVDTQVVTTDQGVGMLRYFMMTRLLARCATVEEALADLRALPQAGGGTLVLGDASGAIAAVEIGQSVIAAETARTGWVARTNHFLDPALAPRLLAPSGDPAIDVSHGRLTFLRDWLAGRPFAPDVDEAVMVMSSHDSPGRTGLCRHGADGGSTTVSGAIFACRPRSLYVAHGNPCAAPWTRHACLEPGAVDGLRDRTDR